MNTPNAVVVTHFLSFIFLKVAISAPILEAYSLLIFHKLVSADFLRCFTK